MARPTPSTSRPRSLWISGWLPRARASTPVSITEVDSAFELQSRKWLSLYQLGGESSCVYHCSLIGGDQERARSSPDSQPQLRTQAEQEHPKVSAIMLLAPLRKSHCRRTLPRPYRMLEAPTFSSWQYLCSCTGSCDTSSRHCCSMTSSRTCMRSSSTSSSQSSSPCTASASQTGCMSSAARYLST
ncbi:guanine nucleotide-binding protein G(I)/G(S)/G(O) subunit gamma-13 isoform X2 [Pteropus medius]|uniref:guanine nucleotide-binding protein G(I)/G(S)/G(O) subunit gamma-13 isoform X2 n=1 Tax=Pteropus vampyrus TaxID=132908 RepID=UPI00196B0F93|nr:guanine nucleotide-binding protein G(I)/G(S)/G(O) subunit gamma-13 isoform X2 [Pteropus giganteus]